MSLQLEERTARRSRPGRAAPFAARRHVRPSPYFAYQAVFGRVVAAVLLAPGLPIMLFLMLLVRLTSRGPAIYSQDRVGKGGRTFRMYKIRTMIHDAEAKCGPQWATPTDPRITWLGRYLRKLHLDEFPQLFNVLRGDMSLIGPRPERPEFTQVLAREIPGYLERLAVLPGITGLAQINLPPDTDLANVRRKLVLDLEYIETANILLDLRMFISTLLRLVCVPGDLAMAAMLLHRDIPLPSGKDATSPGCTPETVCSKGNDPLQHVADTAIGRNGDVQKRNGLHRVNGHASAGAGLNGHAANNSGSPPSDLSDIANSSDTAPSPDPAGDCSSHVPIRPK